MGAIRCPGQDWQQWKPNDIYAVFCPHCNHEMEFWKDEPMLYCPACHQPVRSPKLNLGCAEWCRFAGDCLGELSVNKP